MITRLFAHNFRCLVNFELRLGPINLLMGPNGAGKSTVFDLLHTLCRFVVDRETTDVCFKTKDLPRWNREQEIRQRFELEIDGNGGKYFYSLEVEHILKRMMTRISAETLVFDGAPLYDISSAGPESKIRLYRDDYSLVGEYLTDGLRSFIGAFSERGDMTRLAWFRKQFSNILVIRPNPAFMGAESREAAPYPGIDLADFASWYRYLMENRFGQVSETNIALREIIPSFDYFRLQEAGDSKLLKAQFKFPGGNQEYRLDELSDGQRVLIALYTALYCAPEEDGIVCIDEPENFVALPEIQLWLDELDARCQEGKLQALLISHHPKPINYLARDAGLWIERIGVGEPSRVLPIRSEGESTGLSVAQLVERGWIFDE